MREEIAAGKFRNTDEFMEKAIEHFLWAREFGETYSRQDIETKILRARQQLVRGEGMDGEEFFEKLRLRGEELRRICKPD